jgi:hypothetical protein
MEIGGSVVVGFGRCVTLGLFICDWGTFEDI